MKVIIAGSRTIKPYPGLISYAVYCSKFQITEVVCGDAAGIDSGGAAWAALYNIPVTHFKPNWDAYGKRAGYLRNEQMADYADALILIWDGVSKGSGHMLEIAQRKGLPTFVLKINESRFHMEDTDISTHKFVPGIGWADIDTRDDQPIGV